MVKIVPPNQYTIPEMRRIKRIHFVGIGGVGMCGIAEVLLNQGYEISGSDIKVSPVTQRLASHGAQIFIGHQEANVRGAHVVVVSTAVTEENHRTNGCARSPYSGCATGPNVSRTNALSPWYCRRRNPWENHLLLHWLPQFWLLED